MAIVNLPHSAKQREFLDAILNRDDLDTVVFAGSRFNGKTHVSSLAMILRRIQHGRTQGLMLRKTVGAADTNLKSEIDKCLYAKPSEGGLELPPESIRYFKSERTYLFPNASTIKLGYCKTPSDYSKYHGSEWTDISFEEGQQHLEESYDLLGGSNRSGVTKSKMWLTANPGENNEWLLRRFRDKDTADPKTLWIHCKVSDAPQRHDIDAGYVQRRLMPLDAFRRKQWIDGDFSAVASSYFDVPDSAVCELIPPYWADGYAGLDYGFSAPMACLWISRWQDAQTGQQHCHVAAEYYRTFQHLDEQATAVKDMEESLRERQVIHGDGCIYYADPAVAKPVESVAAEAGRTIRSVWAANGLYANPAHTNARVPGWQLIKWLLVRGVLTIDPSCRALLRELQSAQYEGAPGPPTSEDLDKRSARGSHCLDALRYCISSIYRHDYPGRDIDPYTR